MKGLAMLFKKWFPLMSLLLLSACASGVDLEAYRNEWVTRTLPELKQHMSSPDSYASKVQWQETTYKLANGNFIFVEPIEKDCYMHWEVRPPRNIIIGSSFKGSGCKVEDKNANPIEYISPAQSTGG